MTVITSTTNPAVKHIRALRHRKVRESSGLFYAEGIRFAGEAAALALEVETCVLAPDLLTSSYAWEAAEVLVAKGAARLLVSDDVFRAISQREGPQGIGIVARQRWTQLHDAEPGNTLCWIALKAVQDPGNLGTILRTSDAAGAAGVMLIGDATDPYSPASVRASMGAIFSQRLVRTGVQGLKEWAHRYGASIVGTSDSAERDYLDVHYPAPLVLYMGSEREGLSVDDVPLCDEMTRIPMSGHSDSLNLAVATGIMLYEIRRQRLYPNWR